MLCGAELAVLRGCAIPGKDVMIDVLHNEQLSDNAVVVTFHLPAVPLSSSLLPLQECAGFEPSALSSVECTIGMSS